MKPKEKAKELVDKFRGAAGLEGRECALICVDEIIKTEPLKEIHDLINEYYSTIYYWQEVKQEINQL